MYLQGLHGVTTIPGASFPTCTAAGGIWSPGQYMNQGTCTVITPDAASAPASVNVSVPTNVTTQVSPQISPILTQQDQPVSSPVTAGTTSAPQQSAGDAAFTDYLKTLAEQQAADRKAMMDALAQASAASAAPAPSMTPISTVETYGAAPSSTVPAAPVAVNNSAPAQSIPWQTILLVLAGGAAVYAVTANNRNKRKGK